MKEKKIFGFPQNVFILSVNSFLNDLGGESIKRLIPLFLGNILGTPTSIIGLVEGVGEATPQVLQPVSGFLSDKWQKRKPFLIFGQILRSSMILLFWASSWPFVLLVRFLDRSGKGTSNAPRDALISLSSEENKRGKAFGLSRALDDAGAVLGLILAGLIVFFSQKEQNLLEPQAFTKIVLLAAIPLLLALVFFIFLVKEKKVGKSLGKTTFKGRFSSNFYYLLALSFLFSLGNSSDGFLLLRAQNLAMPIYQIFFLFAATNFLSSLVDLPAGIASDRLGRKRILITGWLIYSFVYLGFAQNLNTWSLVLLFLLYGVYYGLTQGVAKALVTDLVPGQKQGTAFGLYNLVTGLTLLPASLLAGFLWQMISPSAPFYLASVLTAAAAFGLVFLKTQQSPVRNV